MSRMASMNTPPGPRLHQSFTSSCEPGGSALTVGPSTEHVFRLVNMRSADLTARARIRDAAIAQFAEHGDHLAVVDEVLETLMHDQDDEFSPGSDRCLDPPKV